MSEKTYKLGELAKAAGTSPRTVRYYVQRGLLPAPSFRGKDSAYSPEHLVRLRAIRRLQDAYLPLEAILAELEGKDLRALEAIANGSRPAEAPARAGTPARIPPPPVDPGTASPGRVWRRIELAPGLEVHVADDASPLALALAERVLETSSTAERRK